MGDVSTREMALSTASSPSLWMRAPMSNVTMGSLDPPNSQELDPLVQDPQCPLFQWIRQDQPSMDQCQQDQPSMDQCQQDQPSTDPCQQDRHLTDPCQQVRHLMDPCLQDQHLTDSLDLLDLQDPQPP